MINPKVTYVETATWANAAASLVMAAVEQNCLERGTCSVMLTGGRSAAQFYEAWAALPAFSHLRNVHFFLR